MARRKCARHALLAAGAAPTFNVVSVRERAAQRV
jgi:hypothetical protein